MQEVATELDDAIREIASRAGVESRRKYEVDSPAPAPEPSHDLAPAEDPINPAHYRTHPSGIECIEVTRHMTFNLGNCVKYIWRAGQKNDIIEDLRKAQWYLADEIQRLGGK